MFYIHMYIVCTSHAHVHSNDNTLHNNNICIQQWHRHTHGKYLHSACDKNQEINQDYHS